MKKRNIVIPSIRCFQPDYHQGFAPTIFFISMPKKSMNHPPLFSLPDPDASLDSVEAIEEYFVRVQAEFQSQFKEVSKSTTSLDQMESLLSSSMPLLQEKLRNALLGCSEEVRQEYLEKEEQKREQEYLAQEAAKKAKRESRKSKGK